MKRVITAVVLIPVVLLLLFTAPYWLFALVAGAIIVLALREYLDIVEASGIKPFRRLVYVVSVLPIAAMLYPLWRGNDLLFFSRWFRGMDWWTLVPLAAIIFGTPLIFRKDLHAGLASVAASVFGVMYISVSLSLLITLRLDYETTLFVFLLFSVWAGDIAAYYVGKSFGRHKLAPVVSPNKSWEGAVASIAASVTVALLVMHFRPQLLDLLLRIDGMSPDSRATFVRYAVPIRSIHAICLGALTNVAAQFGDLFESALKRGANIKDSGTIIPGHGGLLDRIDALLFAIPVVWYYAAQTGLLLKMSDSMRLKPDF